MGRNLNHREVIAVSQILSRHFTNLGNGVWSYDKDWSDERVAKECRVPGVTPQHVRNLRRSAFGRTVLEASPRKDLENRVANLEERVDVLWGYMTNLETSSRS
jgi:hypothetical protein